MLPVSSRGLSAAAASSLRGMTPRAGNLVSSPGPHCRFVASRGVASCPPVHPIIVPIGFVTCSASSYRGRPSVGASSFHEVRSGPFCLVSLAVLLRPFFALRTDVDSFASRVFPFSSLALNRHHAVGKRATRLRLVL